MRKSHRKNIRSLRERKRKDGAYMLKARYAKNIARRKGDEWIEQLRLELKNQEKT